MFSYGNYVTKPLVIPFSLSVPMNKMSQNFVQSTGICCCHAIYAPIHNLVYYIHIAPVHDTGHNSGVTFKTLQFKNF